MNQQAELIKPMILDTIDRAFDKRSWHGTNLRGAIRGVNRQQALKRVQPDRHNIWEHVLHAAYWKYTVRRRILGESRGSFPMTGSDWIVPATTTEKEWRAAVTMLIDIHLSLREAISQLSVDEILHQGNEQQESLWFYISGIAMHDIYHAGQIKLLRRLIA